ncbi:MAG: hypothetical protein H7Z17_14050 [Fuerstia sp.]|nr:hypothetical protein [Fuerstiella sp.]
MARHLVFCVLAFVGGIATTNADHFLLYQPRPVVAVPMVVYQPAYVVPTVSYAVTQAPVTTVSYTTSYYAPLVPAAAAYYVPATVQAAPVYAVPVYSAPVYGYGHRVHSHLNVHRNGSYNYRLRVR